METILSLRKELEPLVTKQKLQAWFVSVYNISGITPSSSLSVTFGKPDSQLDILISRLDIHVVDDITHQRQPSREPGTKLRALRAFSLLYTSQPEVIGYYQPILQMRKLEVGEVEPLVYVRSTAWSDLWAPKVGALSLWQGLPFSHPEPCSGRLEQVTRGDAVL